MKEQKENTSVPSGSEKLLTQIANHHLFYGSFNPDLGLYNGKMGMVVFFFHYARYTGNPLYEDFAEEFLNEILDSLHIETPVNFKRGLSGIGGGIIYLIKQGFIETDIAETFRDFDDKIKEYDVRNMKDRSLETGVGGIATYVHSRLSVSQTEKETPFGEDYRRDLCKVYPAVHSEPEIWAEIVKDEPEADALSWKTGLRILLKEKEYDS